MKTYKEAKEELLDVSYADGLVDEGLQEFWDTVNAEVYRLQDIAIREFKKMCGEEPAEADVEEWRDALFSAVSSALKDSI